MRFGTRCKINKASLLSHSAAAATLCFWQPIHFLTFLASDPKKSLEDFEVKARAAASVGESGSNDRFSLSSISPATLIRKEARRNGGAIIITSTAGAN